MCDENIFSQENLAIMAQAKETLAHDQNLRNEVIKQCPVCGSRIQDRVAMLHRELINTLYQIYIWCGEKKRHEFTRKEINHLLTSKSDYARFGDLIRFGGLIYRPKDENEEYKKAHFGLNMARAKEFFRGERQIPLYIVLNQITNEIIESHYVTVKDFESLTKRLNDDGMYDYQEQLSLINLSE